VPLRTGPAQREFEKPCNANTLRGVSLTPLQGVMQPPGYDRALTTGKKVASRIPAGFQPDSSPLFSSCFKWLFNSPGLKADRAGIHPESGA
jgi:hypothetical protein